MTIVFGAPSTHVPGPPAELWPGIKMTWEGYDPKVGSTTLWDLTNNTQGLKLLKGVRGLGRGESKFYEDTFAGIPGSRHRKAVKGPREVYWPLRMYTNAGSQQWLDLDSAFWRTLNENRTGIWRVKQPSGEVRSLQLRLVSDGDPVTETDPSIIGYQAYGVTLKANQPYWEGTPVRNRWKASPPVEWQGGPGVMNVSSSSDLATATMLNAGEVDAYPVWMVVGPTTEVEVGVGGRKVEIPFPVPAGHAAVVDTRRTAQTCYVYEISAEAQLRAENDPSADLVIGLDLVNPVRRTQDLGMRNFAPIPAGGRRQLSLAMSGTGMVKASLTPLFERAW